MHSSMWLQRYDGHKRLANIHHVNQRSLRLRPPVLMPKVWSGAKRSGLRSKGLASAKPLGFSKAKGLVMAGGQYQTFVVTLPSWG